MLKGYRRDIYDGKTVAGGGTEALLWSQRWIGKKGVGIMLGVGVQDPNNWATTTFSFRINGVPDRDYGSIQARIGSIDLMTPCEIYLPPYCLIECYVTNAAANPDLFEGRLVMQLLE